MALLHPSVNQAVVLTASLEPCCIADMNTNGGSPLRCHAPACRVK